MIRRWTFILVAVFMLLVSMEVAYVLAQEGGNNNGNNNNGNFNGNNNTGSNNGNNNNGSFNGNNNTGSNNGNNNNGSNNGNNNNGSNNGNNNNGSNNGNNNNGNNNGNNNNGNNNGNNNNGNNNGNNNNGNNNGNYNNGNNNGNNGSGSNTGNNNNGNNNNGNNNNGNNNNNNNNSNGNNNNNNNNNSNGNNNNGQNNGTGNTGKNNGNNNNGNKNGNGNGKKPYADSAVTEYDILTPSAGNGREKGFCKAKGACHFKTLECPAECPTRKPKKNKKDKGCFINCSSKCEATCKWRKPKCDGYGSLCYDPRFVGGDGVMFYFHGAKGGNFAVVSDEKLQINAHFIGTRPQGRTRDFTWVQALSVMFDTHTLVIAAKKVSHWDDKVDALIVKWDGETIEIPTDGEAEWRPRTAEREVVVERTDDANNVRVTVTGLLEMDVKVRPIGKEENKVHKYKLPEDDAFAHLETQFRFSNLTDRVEGILGKTYRPGYVSPVKVGVPMPIMGGEDKYQTPSLYSSVCKFCIFQRPADQIASA